MVNPRAPTSRKTMEKLGHRRRAQAEKKSWPSAKMVNGAPAARLCYQAAQQVVVLEEKPAERGRAGPRNSTGGSRNMSHGAAHDVSTRLEAAITAALGRRSVVLVGMMGSGK